MAKNKTSSRNKKLKTKNTAKNRKKHHVDSSEFLEFKGFLSFLILHELSKKQLCGQELAEKIGKRKGSKLTPGAIYPTLKKLRRMKLISYRRKGRHKYYRLTDLGQQVLSDLYKKFSRYFYGFKQYIKRY